MLCARPISKLLAQLLPEFLVFTHVTSTLTTVAICHVGAQTNALTVRKVSLAWSFALFLDVEVEVTEIKGLDFIEYLQW